jgi:sialic acid synthase SpsE
MKLIEIDGKFISNNSIYTIVESGINHNGSIQTAYQMIEVAKESGADAIKFQTFRADEFCDKESYLYPIFKKCEIRSDHWQYIKERCDLFKITFLSTPQNFSDLEILLGCGVKAIKIGSDDLTNVSLIRKYSETKLPIILSCGMADESEINIATETIREYERHYPLILMHCTSSYPTFPKDVNMRKLIRMGVKYPEMILGYSDHTYGHIASVLAVAYGARVFETHFTLDNNYIGPDHEFSKNPKALKIWVNSIREAYDMLGNSDLRPTKQEEDMRIVARRTITAIKDIRKGDIFTDKNIGMMRPAVGLPSLYLPVFLNAEAGRDIDIGEKLRKEDIAYQKMMNNPKHFSE